MPTYTRGVGNSVALTFTSIFEILYQQTFELMLYESLTPSLPFYIFSITCVVVFIILWRLLPETKGLSLEDASSNATTTSTTINNQTTTRDDNKNINKDEGSKGI